MLDIRTIEPSAQLETARYPLSRCRDRGGNKTGNSQFLYSAHAFCYRNAILPTTWRNSYCAVGNVLVDVLADIHRLATAHAEPVLLLRHELASRGHMLHRCGHGRQKIRRRSPELVTMRLNRTMMLSSQGAIAQCLSSMVGEGRRLRMDLNPWRNDQ